MKKLFSLILIMLIMTGCAVEGPLAANSPAPSTGIIAESAKSIVVLSYPNPDLTKLTRVTYELAGTGNSLAYASVAALLAGRDDESYYTPFNGNADIESVAVSRNVAKVSISGDFASVSDRQFFCSVVSLANTLTELDEIEYVKLKINESDYKPLGIFTNPLTHQSEDLYLLYLKHRDYIKNGISPAGETGSKKLLYFSDFSGKFLLAEVRSSYQSGENLAVDLFNLLKSGPAASDEMKGTIPKNIVMQNEPQVREDPEDGMVLTIFLEAPKHEAIDNDARYMLAASIVSTMQSNIIEIDAVRVFINSQPAISTSTMKESDFDGILGNIATLYFPNPEMTYLIPVNRAMSQIDYRKPGSRINELISGLLANETDSAVNIFPEGITGEDLNSVSVSGGVAYIDFALKLSVLCDYDAAHERMLMYSIVNTLTELNSIKRVQILIDGETSDSLCGHLSISEPLLPNPGIIQR